MMERTLKLKQRTDVAAQKGTCVAVLTPESLVNNLCLLNSILLCDRANCLNACQLIGGHCSRAGLAEIKSKQAF